MDVESPQLMQVLQYLGGAGVERPAIVLGMLQIHRTIAAHVNVYDLNIGLAIAQIILAGQFLADQTVALVVMDGFDFNLTVVIIIQYAEQLQVADNLGRQELEDETLVLEVTHGELQGLDPRQSRDIGKPAAILLGRVFADAAQIAHHREAERIRIDAAVMRAVESGLKHNAGVRLQEFEHESIGNLAA